MADMDTQTLAFASGATGAVLTALFTYVGSRLLKAWERKAEERKTSYVHYLRMCDIVASGEILGWFSKLLASGVLKQGIGRKTDDYEGSHFWIASIHYYITSHDKNSEEVASLRPWLSQAAHIGEMWLDFALPHDVLLKLPRESILDYQEFAWDARNLTHSLKAIKNLQKRASSPSLQNLSTMSGKRFLASTR